MCKPVTSANVSSVVIQRKTPQVMHLNISSGSGWKSHVPSLLNHLSNPISKRELQLVLFGVSGTTGYPSSCFYMLMICYPLSKPISDTPNSCVSHRTQ